MEKEIRVYIDCEDTTLFVGRLWSRIRGRRESATFEYARSWLNEPKRFALEPALKLIDGPQHTPSKKAIFGALGDSAPDRWGRMLMRRAERYRANEENAAPRTLMEIDYLLQVNDETRQGALRFAQEKEGPFLTQYDKEKIPPLVELSRLLSATESLAEDAETNTDIRLLLAPGSSLGGARPKASVRDHHGELMLAKFPHKEDEYNTVMWEALALSLAELAGISVPSWRIERVAKKPVLLLKRFDRVNQTRVPFLSAMSMLEATDNDTRSYLEIADAIRQNSTAPGKDLRELWRRIVFNVLISNTDDHLRNHGFLYSNKEGWKLSPAYDMNPVPTDIKPRILSTSIDFDNANASIEIAMSVIGYFGLNDQQAKKILRRVENAVRTWKECAKQLGIPTKEIKRMASAFQT